MTKVHQVLGKKEKKLWTIDPKDSVYDAITLMAKQQVGALLVFENSRLCGIITERDYARKVIVEGKSSKSTSVSEIMTAEVKSVCPQDSLDYCLSLMTDNYIRHLPVTDQTDVVGILSIGDLVKAKINEQQHTIEQLEHYIHQ